MTELDAGLIGRASVVLGGGRDQVDDEIDPAVGIMIAATVGDCGAQAGDPLLRVLLSLGGIGSRTRCRF